VDGPGEEDDDDEEEEDDDDDDDDEDDGSISEKDDIDIDSRDCGTDSSGSCTGLRMQPIFFHRPYKEVTVAFTAPALFPFVSSLTSFSLLLTSHHLSFIILFSFFIYHHHPPPLHRRRHHPHHHHRRHHRRHHPPLYHTTPQTSSSMSTNQPEIVNPLKTAAVVVVAIAYAQLFRMIFLWAHPLYAAMLSSMDVRRYVIVSPMKYMIHNHCY